MPTIYNLCLIITSSLGLSPDVSSQGAQRLPLCWYMLCPMRRVFSIPQVAMLSGMEVFQPIRITFLAWNKAREKAFLVISSGIASSKTPTIQQIGSRGTAI